ncbi:type II toxin-antitoxin system PemK/MazF family toxin [Metabacillus halosaccharovorans]|uniref:type II toxin-antitoxin system PemK/MazF family toxin n=1 Tax=Metabacillus halosaccharovorans TaxID=930124 RepID=UPI00203F7783|nr:type II toxin-antitoxin system PemK/MazF family toxin [Metabacillus halosaccharovorans]MCM3442963.1 type II toxin-antitoxin system PemK/MazF family toxin [Metabacillus halosaccharovorans]
MSNFLTKSSWGNIERGFEFEAAMLYPSDTQRPLSFFIPDEPGSNKGEIQTDIGDFSPVRVGGRRPQAREQMVVMTIKPRRVVVLSNDEINQSTEFEYILVAPINTIKDEEKTRDWYNKLINDEHPIFTYLPNGNLDRYADLSQTVSIHKSLLLRKLRPLEDPRMEVLDENLIQCLSLGIIEDEESLTDN